MQRRAFLVFLVALGCSKHAPAPAPSKVELRPLTVDQVETRINAHDGKTFVFDANYKESWDSAHVPTAKWIDDENVTAEALGPDKQATYIFYCQDED
jgi:hypothetical protein